MDVNEICPEETKCVDELKMPGVFELAQNLMKDGSKIVSNAVKGNDTFVSEEVKNHRWSICQKCPNLQNDRCVKCGCFMKVKVAFITSTCPIEHW